VDDDDPRSPHIIEPYGRFVRVVENEMPLAELEDARTDGAAPGCIESPSAFACVDPSHNALHTVYRGGVQD
jgi:hypothetical protein